MESTERDEPSPLVTRLRSLVRQYVEKHHYQTALFWADKVASLSKYETQDVYMLAQCMFHVGDYERAVLLIKSRGLHEKYSAFRYLAAKCYAHAKEWQLALDLLEDSTLQVIPKRLFQDVADVPGIPSNKEMKASILLLKGDIYEAKDTRDYAAQCYEEALTVDVFCYEAYEHLVSHHLLHPAVEQELLRSLPFSEQCKTEEEKELLTFLYGTKIEKYNKPTEFEIPKSLDNLHENFEVAATLAERHYYNCEFRSSYKVTSGILRSDPYHSQCLPLHIALLVVLEKTNELFYLAHRLIKRYPEKPISWYAVGCYYLLQPKKQELARRYLLKTTLIDKMYGPAWLALGHSFALESEHDQAMAAYFTATQLMRGSHLPYLYSGIEYSITNNLSLTDRFFTVALHVCPDDPHTLHEIGVASYTVDNHNLALKYFTKALNLLKRNQEEVTSEEWVALLNNLGHCHRKLKNYEASLEFHQQALILAPHSSQTYSAIGFVLGHMERYGEALEYLHKALGLRRDDVFAASLFEHVIEQYAETEPVLYGDDMNADEDMGPPAPFPRDFGGSNRGKPDDVVPRGGSGDHDDSGSAMESEGQISPSLPQVDAKAVSEKDTPAQMALEGVLSATEVLDDVDGFQTPDDFALNRAPPPPLRGMKKAPSKAWRMAPPPLFRAGVDDTPQTDDSAVITPVISSRKMLALVSSESSDDGGLLATPVEDVQGALGEHAEKAPNRFRAPSVEDAWSTSVVKGGGRGFETAQDPNNPCVSDSVILMLGDSAASASDSSVPSASESRTSDVQETADKTAPGERETQQDESAGADMELDDTLDT